MISRRTFSQQAALFVLGCALQVCGAVTAIKRKVERLDQFDIGMVFYPNTKDPSESWQVVDGGKDVICDGAGGEVNNTRRNKWLCLKKGDMEPQLFCFDFDADMHIAKWNCHFPGI